MSWVLVAGAVWALVAVAVAVVIARVVRHADHQSARTAHDDRTPSSDGHRDR